MKILFLAPQPFYEERGTPIAVRGAAAALGEAGHEVDLLVYHCGADVEIGGVRIHRSERPALVRRVPIGASWQKAACDLRMMRRAASMVRAGRYDLVHAVEEAAFMALRLRRRFGTPFVYDMDSLMSEQLVEKSRLLAPAAAVFSRLERAAVARSVGVLGVCPALVEAALSWRPTGHVALLPDMALNAGGASASPAEEVAGAPGVRLLYVGNLEAYQGVELMLGAFVRVARRREDATLLIVGGKGEQIELLRRRVPGVGALCDAGRVRFLGTRPVPQLGGLLAGADVLVSPRRAGRNTPMKIYSYLEAGRAVLATRLPTHTQVLDDRVSALVDPTEEGMAEGMVRLIGDASERERLGAAGREYVRREFGPEAFRRRLLVFYEEVERVVREGRGRREGVNGTGGGAGALEPE